MVKVITKWMCWAGLAGLLVIISVPLWAASKEASVPVPKYLLWVDGNAPSRAQRQGRIIEQALERSKAKYGPYQLSVSQENALGMHWRQLLAEGEKIHVAVSSHVSFPPEDLTLIPIAIDGGLLGYRHLVVRRDQLQEFDSVEQAFDLRKKTAGQGRYWPDMWVYEANELPVKGAENLSALFRLLERGEIDYLPLGVDETASILTRYATDSEHFAIVPDLLIYYPLSSFPVVSNQRPELIKRLRDGLETMRADGALQASSPGFVPSTKRIIKLVNPVRLFPVH